MMVDKSLFDHGQNIVLTNDDDFLPVQLDLGASVFGVDHLLAYGHLHFDFLTVYHAAGADSQHLGHLGFFLGGGGQDDAALGGFFSFYVFDDHAVTQRFNGHEF